VLLYLVRHGQSRANADFSCREVDCELTALGQEQAERVAARLSGAGISQVLSSPYRRTVATAREIARACGAPLALLPSSHEHHGVTPADWTPPTRAELLWRYPDLAIPSDMPESTWHQLPETAEIVYARMLVVAESLRTQYRPDDKVTLVSHASPIQQLVAAATGAYSSLDATRLVIGNASLTILDLGVTPARLESLGQAEFLQTAEAVLL